MLNIKDIEYTPAPWYAVDYAGYFMIQDKDGYQEGSDVLDKSITINAGGNAKIAAAAPELLNACINLMQLKDDYLITTGLMSVGIDASIPSIEDFLKADEMILSAIKKATE